MRLDTRGREIYLGLILLMGCMPATAYGTEVHFQSDTIIRAFERNTVNKEDATVLPIYEYMRLDAGQLTDFGLSYHMYGWGRADLANNDFFTDQTSGQLLYGYVEYKQQANRFDAKLGRQHIFAGVSNVDVDGVSAGGDLGDYFSLSLYGGQPVAYNAIEGNSGDSIFGGRLANRLSGRYELETAARCAQGFRAAWHIVVVRPGNTPAGQRMHAHKALVRTRSVMQWKTVLGLLHWQLVSDISSHPFGLSLSKPGRCVGAALGQAQGERVLSEICGQSSRTYADKDATTAHAFVAGGLPGPVLRKS